MTFEVGWPVDMGHTFRVQWLNEVMMLAIPVSGCWKSMPGRFLPNREAKTGRSTSSVGGVDGLAGRAAVPMSTA